MMEPMRHTGKSGKFAVICGVVAAGLLVLTAMTLAEPVFLAFLGVLGLAYLAALGEILVRRRRIALLAAGAGTALALGFSLAFLSTWELAFDGQSSFLGTPLPTHDPDNYFLGAACAFVATFGVLFLGALLPGRRRTTAPRRQALPPRGAGQGQGRAAAQRPGPQASTRPAAPRAGRPATPSQRSSGVRTPAGGPAVGAKRPASSASPPAKPVPRSGSSSAARR